LLAGVEPVRVPAPVNELYPYTVLIVVSYVMSDPFEWDPLLDITISFYVVVP
jgi:hypothetical protein